MDFEKRMARSHEKLSADKELRGRAESRTIEDNAENYEKQVNNILTGKDRLAATVEIAKFAKKISETKGPEQYAQLLQLARTLKSRKPSFFDTMPDDEEYESAAFALALVNGYQKTLQ